MDACGFNDVQVKTHTILDVLECSGDVNGEVGT